MDLHLPLPSLGSVLPDTSELKEILSGVTSHQPASPAPLGAETVWVERGGAAPPSALS